MLELRRVSKHYSGIAVVDDVSFSARRGEVTSGNVDVENWFEGQVIPAARAQEAGTILFSNENLFHAFDPFLDNHRKYAAEFDFEIILFVREPFEKLNSAYQQVVKRRGFAGDIAEFADHDGDAAHAARLLQVLKAESVSFTLFNYSALRRSAIQAFFQHLGLWDLLRSEGQADVGTVNRSLTHELRNRIGATMGAGQLLQMPELADTEKERLVGIVAKQHLAGDGIHYEPRWFKPWPAGITQQLSNFAVTTWRQWGWMGLALGITGLGEQTQKIVPLKK